MAFRLRRVSGFVAAPAALALLVLAAEPPARSQGLLVVRGRFVSAPPARPFEVKEVSLDARIRDQVAEVRVSQVFHNPGSAVIDSEYLFPLPEDGAVQNFVLLVDGKELPGRLIPKDEARRIYEEIVRTRRDPALLEYMGRGLYRTSVFPIPPGADRKVTMRYTQVLKRDRGVVEFTYPLATQKFSAKPVRDLNATVRIEGRDAIKSVYCPTYDARIDRPGDREARVEMRRHDTVPPADFRLIYTLAEGSVGASVLSDKPSSSEDGYFLVMASPEVKAADAKRPPKTVIFVLDRSGSMAGKKIEQARKALTFVLQNLRDDDTFNIVVYDDRVETFKPELQRYSERTRREAERFVENIREGGSTNIDEALKTSLKMVQDDSRPSYVLFLTDGLPTAGETQENLIASHARDANRNRARVFSFGVGYDVNARLLDRLAAGNSGTSEYVKPDDDIEAHLGRYYAKMTAPALTDVRVTMDDTDLNRTYPRDVPDLFDGGQLLLVGRYRRGGPTTLKLSGKVGGERRSFEFPADLARDDSDSSNEFVARLWATRRIGDLIDQMDLNGRNQELIDELVSLSTRYGIMTPFTSFLADETVPLHARAENQSHAKRSLERLAVVTGEEGVFQRDAKQELKLAERAAGPAATPFGTSEPRFAGRNQSMGGMGGGMMGGLRPAAPSAGSAAPALGLPQAKADYRGGFAGKPFAQGAAQVRAQDAAKDAAATVLQVGPKTFYRKGSRWVDSAVTPEAEAKAVVIRQFSDAFFALARGQKAEMNRYLAFDEPVTVEIGGTVYKFEPDGKDAK